MSSTVFKDLFASIEKKQQEREEWLAKNPPPDLSVREAIAISAYLYDNQFEPTHIYNVLFPNTYSDEPFITAKKALDDAGSDYADKMIDYWRHALFMSKMSKTEKLSSWRESLSHLLADPDATFKHDTTQIVASLPRYYEYEQRYIRLGNEYKTLDKRKKKSMNINMELDYIEHWEERNSKKTRTTVYAFKSPDDYLVLLPITIARNGHTNTMLNELLKFTNKFKIRGRVYTKILEPEKFALQFDHFVEFEAIK